MPIDIPIGYERELSLCAIAHRFAESVENLGLESHLANLLLELVVIAARPNRRYRITHHRHDFFAHDSSRLGINPRLRKERCQRKKRRQIVVDMLLLSSHIIARDAHLIDAPDDVLAVELQLQGRLYELLLRCGCLSARRRRGGIDSRDDNRSRYRLGMRLARCFLASCRDIRFLFLLSVFTLNYTRLRLRQIGKELKLIRIIHGTLNARRRCPRNVCRIIKDVASDI